MKSEKTPGTDGSGGGEYKRFAAKRVIAGILITALVIWMSSLIFGFFDKEPRGTTAGTGHVADVDTDSHAAVADHSSQAASQHGDTAPESHAVAEDDNVDRYKKLFERRVASQDVKTAAHPVSKPSPETAHDAPHPAATDAGHGNAPAKSQHTAAAKGHGQPSAATPHPVAADDHGQPATAGQKPEAPAKHVQAAAQPHAAPADGHGQSMPATQHRDAAAGSGGHGNESGAPATAAAPLPAEPHGAPAAPDPHAQAPAAQTHAAPGDDPHAAPGDDPHAAPAAVNKPRGVAFVEALIHPLDDELNERFWGWRPNDLINVTDNVNTFQLGVLEVTRRTTVILTERISRIGSTASFDDNLEQAMNWFMIKPSRYWLPSPEDKYNEGLDSLRQYAQELEHGTARFYTRTDNLIPLLAVYQDLLGSCDENLAKAQEENGEEVSSFKADDYFFYAQGVASAMMGILEAIHHEFHSVLETRKARDSLHHAIESLHHATAIDPWIILNSDLSSIFANHRANMAAPISHARFYLGVAIGALST